MKKIITLFLTVLIVFSIATGVMAAQTFDEFAAPGDEISDYLPTPTGYGTFVADGVANYPNEIYLPNEEDPANYRIHTSYSKNTDACASCHATHTAVGPSLLQWENVYFTCLACHDGSVTTTYDVKNGFIGSTISATYGGVFPDYGPSRSKHDVEGTWDIFGAPGGALKEQPPASNPDQNGANASWEPKFGCQSCHSPHGQGGNARILNPNPNGVGWTVYNSQASTKVVLRWDTIKSVYYTDYNNDNTKDFWLKGYPYNKVTLIYAVNAGGGIIDAEADGPPGPSNPVEPDPIDASFYSVYNGNTEYSEITFTTQPGLSEAGYKASFVPALKVKMTINNYLQVDEKVKHDRGLNTFCGACHTDYNTEDDLAVLGGNAEYNKSGSHLTGEFSEAYRHQVGMDTYSFETNYKIETNYGMKLEGTGLMSCETCHFAHGTSYSLWKRTVGDDSLLAAVYQFTDDEIVELSGSSALKRLPNMATCEACHRKGDGNEGK